MQPLPAPDQTTLHYIRTGPRGNTPILLLHAVGMDLTMWGPQMEALQKSYDVIALDLPGHGLSPEVGKALSFSHLAAAVVQVVASLASPLAAWWPKR